MKTYIFITMAISGIGGATQYIYNKIKYLKSQGWHVYVFSSFNRKIIIHDLNEYKNQIIPALMYPPSIFTKKEIENTLCRMCRILGDLKGEIIIESTSVDAAKWGELLASKLNAKNFIFNLQEKHCYSPSEIAFLKYKLERKELSGITPSAVGKMIGEPDFQTLPYMAFSAPCSNVVQDVQCDLLQDIPKSRLTIGSIGRLEKEFLYKVLLRLKSFFEENPDDYFNLLLIGGSDKFVVKKIKRLFNNCPNVNLIITGYLYPIPKKLLYSCDLFISTAGAAYVSYNYGRPTLKAHPFSGDILGVMGNSYDADSGDFLSDNYKSIDLVSTILKIENKDIGISYNDYDENIENKEIKDEFERELSIERDSSSEKRYYDVFSIKPPKNKKNLLYKVLGKFLGGDIFQKTIEFMRRCIPNK